MAELLAITLLNNINLNDGTLTNANLQLIAHAEVFERTELKQEGSSTSSESFGESREKDPAALIDCFKVSLRCRPNLSASRTKIILVRNIKQTRQAIKYIQVDMMNLKVADASNKESLASINLSKKQVCRLNLKNEAKVLVNLSLTTFSPTFNMNVKGVESLTERHVQKALLSVGSMVEPRCGAPDHENKRGNGGNGHSRRGRPNLDKSDDNFGRAQFSYDCGELGHYRGENQSVSEPLHQEASLGWHEE